MKEPEKSFTGLTCTINTTEDCNLRCKYCYETDKCSKNIKEEYCYKFIDLCMSDTDVVNLQAEGQGNKKDHDWIYRGRVFDFIGGDSLINVRLLDKIMTYINTRWGQLYPKYPNGWRASISTNGTLFKLPEVRKFVTKWKDVLSIGVSIDGCPEIHDMNRIYPDGRGSMADILKWWPWLQKNLPSTTTNTKSTCSKNSIPYLFKSLKFMYEEMGITNINQNFIYENMDLTQKDLDDIREQYEMCIDYLLDHRDELYFSPFDRHRWRIHSLVKDGYANADLEDNPQDINDPECGFYKDAWCGSGMMPCLAINGDIYPCHRWSPTAQAGKGAMCIGNINDLEHLNKEVFTIVQRGCLRCNCTKDEKCKTCFLEPACSYCIAGCWQEYGAFIRQTHICEIHKLEYEMTKEYWRRYDERFGK